MNLQNQKPIFVPHEHWPEFEKLSKAALMDMVWDYAQQIAGVDGIDATMKEFRARRDIVLTHRKQAKDRDHTPDDGTHVEPGNTV